MDRAEAARWAASALLVGTIAAQHPNPAFARPKKLDPFSSLFPNWRFFAPVPAQHDYDIFYRHKTPERTSDWLRLHEITPRKFSQFLWFPERRPEKGLFDIVSELVTTMTSGVDRMMASVPYAMLRHYVQRHITHVDDEQDVEGFQFSIIRHAGHDESEPLEIIFVSPFVPFQPKSEVARV